MDSGVFGFFLGDMASQTGAIECPNLGRVNVYGVLEEK